jgi:hypothetical protein
LAEIAWLISREFFGCLSGRYVVLLDFFIGDFVDGDFVDGDFVDGDFVDGFICFVDGDFVDFVFKMLFEINSIFFGITAFWGSHFVCLMHSSFHKCTQCFKSFDSSNSKNERNS